MGDDFTCVSTWQGGPRRRRDRRLRPALAIVLEPMAYKWRAAGWRVSTSMTTGFVLDALNQAICQRPPLNADALIHHSDRGSQHLSITFTERLAGAGIDTSVGSVGDSYDTALAESAIGLFKAEVVNFLGPWKSMAQVEQVDQVEREPPKWVGWDTNARLHGAIGYIPPREAEEHFHDAMTVCDTAA